MRLSTRWIVLALAAVGSVAAAAPQDQPFAHVDVRLPNGHAFHADVDGPRAGTTSLLFSGEGFLITVDLPKDATAGTAVHVPATLQASEQLLQGTVLVEISDAGAFLGGKLSGAVGPLTLTGSFRVPRLPPVVAGRVGA